MDCMKHQHPDPYNPLFYLEPDEVVVLDELVVVGELVVPDIISPAVFS